MDGMEMLLDENWDGNNPDAGSWVPVNVIPQGDANASAWGVRFPDLPWSFMYDSCAEWVYGNNDWNSPPVSHDHEYYRLPFTVPINGNCVWVRFQAYIDDGAKFYIDGPGFNGPTLFYEHDSDDSMDNHDPVEFLVDPNAPAPICLGPGEYTIYIDHLDTAGVIYGLIFTAECISCQCPCQCGEWDDVEVSWTDQSGADYSWTGSCGETVEPIYNPSGPITVNSSIGCIPDDCSPDYTWEVTTYSGMSLPSPSTGSGLPAEFTPQGSDWNSYVVNLDAYCDGVECPLCTILHESSFTGGNTQYKCAKNGKC
jgi:hypothetical protein